MKKLHKLISVFILLALLLVFTNALAAPGDTTRVSVATGGTEGNNDSYISSISSDGRYVAFYSFASNLVSGDTNGVYDVFVRDTQTNTTTRVSVATGGTEGNDDSYRSSISSDGRYVAFNSDASNLVSGDTNGMGDVFVHDHTTGSTTRVSVATGGAQGNDRSDSPSISSDGRYVAFNSTASNLVSGDTNGMGDVFVHDRTTGNTMRVSVDSGGAQGNDNSGTPSISSDGRYVAFVSDSTTLVSGDTNGRTDVFVHDRTTGNTMRVSVATGGAQGNDRSDAPSISSDGCYVAFESFASNLVSGDTNGMRDVFMHDCTTGNTTRVSVTMGGAQGNGSSFIPSISSDGRYVAFYSTASNLVSGDTNGWQDVFVHDRTTGNTTRVSVDSGGAQGNLFSLTTSISSDGRYVAFESFASNLVSGDTNGVFDVFVHELDVAAPLVAATNLTASYTGTGPASFTVIFSENVNNAGGGAGTEDVTNPTNYRVVNKGINGVLETASCAVPVGGDDSQILPSSVVYTPNTAVATFASPLPAGNYRLFICGTTSIVDLAGNHLNNGVDYTFDFAVSALATTTSATTSTLEVSSLPRTGFAPNVVTRLPEQPAELAYTKMSDLWLEIPSQKVKANIVGVSQSENIWDVKWLGNDAGWLNGTAFPSWEGNSVLTGHVMGADGLPGPFAKLQDLKYGGRVIVHMLDQQYVFEVRNKRLVRPDSTAFAFEHLEGASYLTLVTCSGYNEGSNTYSFRRIIRTVLVEVK